MLLITSRRIVQLGGYNNAVSALHKVHPLASFFVPFFGILRWLGHCARGFFLRHGSSLQQVVAGCKWLRLGLGGGGDGEMDKTDCGLGGELGREKCREMDS